MTEECESPGAACMELRRLGKRYGPTVALHEVSLSVQRGQVHALLGHNGSGKSTIVKIISGYEQPDAGEVLVHARPGTPARIGVVHQDLGLSLDATVLENCWLNGYPVGRWGLIDWHAARRELEPLLERLSAEFGTGDTVGDLSPADQTVVAIARALHGGHRPGRGAGADIAAGELDLLVLDEATARLRGNDADKVLATAQRVAAQGGGVLLVTHHMAEVLRAADRATVLSNGQVRGTVQVADTDEAELLEMVSGRTPTARATVSTTPDERSAALLRVSGLTGTAAVDIALEVAAGEIVGLTGAAGAGFEEVPYLIAGASKAVAGAVTVDGRRAGGSVARRRRQGISLVPADRLSYGLLGTASTRENLSPLVRRRHTAAGLSRKRSEQRWATEVCERFGIVPGDPETRTGGLSGGNQQKVLLARAMEDEPKVLVLHEPTQGVDEGTRQHLVTLIQEMAATGTAVLYVSADIEEVAGCAGRVLVVRAGQLVGQFPGGPEYVDDIYAASYLGAAGEQAS